MLSLLRFGAVLGLLTLTLLACGQGDTPLPAPEEALSLPAAIVAAPTASPTATAIPTPTLFPTATPQPVIRPPATAIPAPTVTPPPTAIPIPTVFPTATPPPVIPTPATPHPTIAPAAIPTPTIAPTATPPPTVTTAAPDAVACDPDTAAPVAIQGEAAEVAAGNNAFALDLYHALRREKDGNLLYSPYSLSLTLAMAYAGAGGETAEQMADTLNFTLPQPDLPPAFNRLNAGMLSRLCADDAPELNIANALWGKEGYQFHTEFQDTLAESYGAELRQLDFAAQPLAATAAINDWVEQETKGKISQIYPADHFARLIDPENVRLILTNAIYFKGQWQKRFEESQTEDADFHLPDGSRVSVPMMYQRHEFRYAEGADYQAVELPYKGGNGDLEMVIVLPAAGAFEDFEEALDAARVQSLLEPVYTREVILEMPRFQLESDFELRDTLREMGMPNAFIPGVADFSGIADITQEGEAGDGIFTSSVAHKAFIEVNEKGTEAAAVTSWSGCNAWGACATSVEPPPVEMTIDRPFIFFLRDKGAGVILFIGRVLDPRG